MISIYAFAIIGLIVVLGALMLLLIVVASGMENQDREWRRMNKPKTKCPYLGRECITNFRCKTCGAYKEFDER